jgi:N-acetylneuraminic acid mutarotase
MFGGRNIRPEFIGRMSLRYDMEVFVWQKREALPESREGGFAFPIGNKIYIMGGIEKLGFDGPDTPNLRIYEYDTDTDSYARIATPLPEGCELMAFDGNRFYLGGKNTIYIGRLVNK